MTIRLSMQFTRCVFFVALVLTGCGRQPPTSGPSAPPAPSAPVRVTQPAGENQMVSIPAGEFTMGSDAGEIDAKPAHHVKVDAFFMDPHEVTQ